MTLDIYDEIARDRKRQEIRDNRRACGILFAFGATEDEVDDILTDRPVPIDPDVEWARRELDRYRLRGEPREW